MNYAGIAARCRRTISKELRGFVRSSTAIPVGLDWLGLGAKAGAGKRSFDPSRKTVLLVCHEATRTGAPILGWNLARQFSETHNVITFIVHPGGDLREHFSKESILVAGPFRRKQLLPLVMQRFIQKMLHGVAIDFAIINSIESQPVAPALAMLGIPTVMLIHEFTTAPGRMTSGLMLATQAIFDAEIQRRAAIAEWPGITTRCQHVFHQGASQIPRFDSGKTVTTTAGTIFSAVRGNQSQQVVLGLGTICMRKGVDLFVSCAQRVVAELGPDRVRFVWIGDLPNPHPEGVYFDWVVDQVKRAGLDKTVVFLDPVDDLSGAFAAADVVFSPSRLDPFPNVAMDAALAGVPVVCFERANGFSEFLVADSRTRALAVSYLDAAAAADRVLGLLSNSVQRSEIGASLKARAEADFPMARYIERLQPVIETAKAITAQERRDVDTLNRDDSFLPLLWCNPHEPTTRENAVRLHVRKAASGQEANQYCRRPALGFVPQTYAEHHPALDAPPFENPLAHWIRAGKPAGPWSHEVIVPREPSRANPVSAVRTALHIHLHYPELAEGILKCLAVNGTALDLFVSTTSNEKAADLAERFGKYQRGPVVVRTCPNRGRDIGPMLTLFAEALQSYDVVGHLHGKRSLALTSVGLSTDLGVIWHEFLLQHLVGDKFPMVDIILERFAANPRLGLVFPEDPNLTGWSLDRDLAIELAARMDPTMVVPKFIDFPIGTMFWARPAALRPLFDLKLGLDDFPEEPVPIDGTMLHALERLFPVICNHAGFEFQTTHVPGVTR